MSKLLRAAGIVRDIDFDYEEELEVYLYRLEHKCISYKILDKHTRIDGSVVVRIVTQYNNTELIEL